MPKDVGIGKVVGSFEDFVSEPEDIKTGPVADDIFARLAKISLCFYYRTQTRALLFCSTAWPSRIDIGLQGTVNEITRLLS